MLEMIPRRGFFLLAAGALLRAEDRAKRDMLVRSVRPEDLEMPPAGFADYITPIEHFFVRTHVYVPDVNGNDWRLRVEGDVATPLTLAMDELKKLIREVPDFPKPGINFYDITTLLKQPEGLRKTVDALAAEFEGADGLLVFGF